MYEASFAAHLEIIESDDVVAIPIQLFEYKLTREGRDVDLKIGVHADVTVEHAEVEAKAKKESESVSVSEEMIRADGVVRRQVI